MSSVFISYSHKDKSFATRLAADLRDAGGQVFKRMGEKVKVGDPLVKVKPNPTPFNSVAAKRSVEAAKLNEERAMEFRDRENFLAKIVVSG